MANKQFDDIDRQAEQEAKSMARAYKSRTMDFGKQLKRVYYVDGFKFNTGEKHRAINRSH